MNEIKTTFASYFKALRTEKRITLRAFCEAAGADPGNISRMERGGMIPQDLMDDAELVKKLPAFFRTLRGQKPTEDELRKVLQKIKETEAAQAEKKK